MTLRADRGAPRQRVHELRAVWPCALVFAARGDADGGRVGDATAGGVSVGLVEPRARLHPTRVARAVAEELRLSALSRRDRAP